MPRGLARVAGTARWASLAASVTCGAVLGLALPAAAQEPSRVSVDSTIEADVLRGDNTLDRPNVIVDVAAVARLGNGWLAYVRPWLRQPRTSDVDAYLYQAALQYQRAGRVSTRLDLGYIASPVGLGMMDTRPGVNPTIMPHMTYLIPMPAFEAGGPRISPLASTYPLGGQLTVSGRRWDARAALVTTAPTRVFQIGQSNPAATPVVEGGAGISPVTGLRLGVSFARGDYVTARELGPSATSGRQLTLVGIEGEWGFGHTALSGEVVRDSLETVSGTVAAYEWFAQGTQTLTPRWFVAARSEGASAPGLSTPTTIRGRTVMHLDEATVGFRVSPELSLRASVIGRKSFTRADWDHQAGISLVWAHRWW